MLEAGDQIDIWVVEKALGSGGMGSVYRCHNRNAHRILAAIKVLESGLRRHPEAEARFIREAEILFQLDHPHIVKVRNVRTDLDPPYLEMEFVEGESLEERLRKGALPFDLTLKLMAQCASALAYLHARGVRHRDIKPANLLVHKEFGIKLVDFGLAMEADVTRITQQGMAFGTVSYAPPEWVAPDTIDPSKWDMYALGVVFWEMLTGEVAFPVSGQGSARQQAMQVIIGKQSHEPLDPGESFHQDLRKLIGDMTLANAEERLGSAAELVERVKSLRQSLEHAPGVTLAPDLPEDFTEDPDSVIISAPLPGLSSTPPKQRATWMSDLGAPARQVVPTSQPALRRRLPLLLGALTLLGVLGTLAVITVIGLGVYNFSGASGRAVELALTGITKDTPHQVALDGQAPATSRGFNHTFANLSVGPHTARWVVGEGCTLDACPGPDCPTWCGTGSQELHVESGAGTASLLVAVEAPPSQVFRLALPDLDEGLEVRAKLGDWHGQRTADGLRFASVLPGKYPLVITAGSCPERQAPCWPDDCPMGCMMYSQDQIVPWRVGRATQLDLHVDTPTPPKQVTKPSEPAPQPAPQPTPDPKPEAPPADPTPGTASAGPYITTGEYARWLKSHPEWQPGGAKANAAKYLEGWNGTTPPPGTKPSDPIHGVTWFAAAAYCRGRGGIAALDAPIEPSGGAIFEWRIKNKRVAIVDLQTKAEQSGRGDTPGIMRHATFRCAK